MTMTKFSRINKQREEITMRVLEDMEKGGNEWKKPWVEASPLPPHNPVSGTQYSGRNFLYTYVYGMMRGYADPRWATEKQIKEMGWKIPENLQNGRGGINDELGVGIEHWGMYAYIPRVKKDGTPLPDKGGTQKFTRVRAVKENGVWGRYRKGDNGKYEFEQLPSGVHPHPECDRYFKVFNLSLTDDWTALNVSDGHYEEESFNHEALAAAFLQGANMGQLRMLNEILDRARLNGPYCLENVADALLSFAPACKTESLMENPMLHFIELSKSFSKNGGIYDPVHGIYIDSKVNGLGDVPHFTLYDVSVADIEECMAWGTKHLDEVPGQIHVVNGSPHIATIYVTGPDDRRINDLIFTLCEDGRWSYVSELDAETLARFNEIIAKADRIEAGIVKDDEWRDGMVEQVSGFMDKIKDMDAEEAEGADTVLAETFNSIDALSTDAAIDLLRVYSNCDASGRDAVAKTFYALSGESFDSYLMTASEVCKKTLGMLEPEPPQPAKAKNLSQKTASSREASTRLSDEIGAKPCTRDEGTVGDS